MIRVAILDRRPAVRAGLETILSRAPDLIPVGAAADEHELWPLLRRARPDVVVLDEPGLVSAVKARHPSPKVVAYLEDADVTPLGADGHVGKSAEQRVLLDVVRAVVHASTLPQAA